MSIDFKISILMPEIPASVLRNLGDKWFYEIGAASIICQTAAGLEARATM
jgi:hypothetical protein